MPELNVIFRYDDCTYIHHNNMLLPRLLHKVYKAMTLLILRVKEVYLGLK